MRLVCCLVIALMLGPSALVAQQPPSAAESQTVTAPALPQKLGPFKLSETVIYEDPLLGTLYKYFQGRMSHVYVAVQPALTLEKTPATPEYLISRAVASFKGIHRTTPDGPGTVEIVQDTPDTLVIGSRTFPGHVVAAIERRGTRAQYSVWYIYALGSRYVRVMGGNSDTTIPIEKVQQEIEAVRRSAVSAVVSAWRQ